MNLDNPTQKLAAAELPREIARIWGQMKTCGLDLQSQAIALANLARQQGMLLIEWRGHDQMKFEFWNKEYRERCHELPSDLSQDAAERCMKVFRACPEVIADFKTANEVLHDVFIAQELLPVPVREHPGVKSALPPLTDFINRNMDATGRLQKYLDHHPLVELNDYESVATLVQETRFQHDLHEQALERIRKLKP